MISKDQFREEHDNGTFEDRPHRVKRLRDEFRAYCDLSPPRSVAAVPEWYDRYKGTITKRLNGEESDGG